MILHMFSIVCFVETNEVDVAPEVWVQNRLNDVVCFWPPYKTADRLTKAKLTCESPGADWEQYPIKVLCKSAVSYDKAVKKLKAICASEPTTNGSCVERVKSRRKKSTDSGDSECDDMESSSDVEGTGSLHSVKKYPRLVTENAAEVETKSSQMQSSPLPRLTNSHSVTTQPSHSPESVESLALATTAQSACSLPQSIDLLHSTLHLPVTFNLPCTWNVLPNLELGLQTTGAGSVSELCLDIKPETIGSATEPGESNAGASKTSEKQSQSAASSTGLLNASDTIEHGIGSHSSVTRQIFTLLEQLTKQTTELMVQVKKNTTLLQLLTGNSSIAQSAEMALPADIELPCSSLESLHHVEKKISDICVRMSLVSTLSSTGGASVTEATRRVLRKLMTNAVAVELNWVGKRGKPGLSTMELKSVIFEAVRLNPSTAYASDAEMESVAARWLRSAADRDGGRQRRAVQAALKRCG